MITSNRIPKTAAPIRACAIALCAAFALVGCQPRTIYVPDGDPVRLREPVKGARVWVADENGKWTPGVIDLPAGWYALPDPGPDGAGLDPDAPIQ